MPEVRKITAAPRPLRVAYLIDPSNCPHALLDEVFREAFGRWGGRRTLLAAATNKGIDKRYSNWLQQYDPDIIYSFVDLETASVAEIHERYTPTFLVRHNALGHSKNDRGYYRVRLPMKGLPSLSTVAELNTFSRRGFSPSDRVRVLDKYPDKSEGQFLAENFGFLSDQFLSRNLAYAYPDVFTCLVLIAEDTHSNSHIWKDRKSEYVFTEGDALRVLVQSPELVTTSQLSDLFAPYIEFDSSLTGNACSLVVGDTVDDRWLYWNLIHRYRPTTYPMTNIIRVSEKSLSDADFMGLVKTVLARSTSSDGGIVVRSCSLEQEKLEQLALGLRKIKPLGPVRSKHASDHAACIIKGATDDFQGLVSPFTWRDDARETSEFENERIPVPFAVPSHLQANELPRDYRGGCWMSDLTIERLVDYCKFENITHTWIFPRRLRLDRAFAIELQNSARPDEAPLASRVLADGSLSIPQAYGQRNTILTTPDDLDAFAYAICVGSEWQPFDRGERGSVPIQRYRHVQLSEKGRYLLGILDRFHELRHAFGVFMNAYWREIIHEFGGVPIEKNASLVQDLVKVFFRRAGQQRAPLSFKTDEEIERMAKEALRVSRQISLGRRSMTYADLCDRWSKWVDQAPQLVRTKDAVSRRVAEDLAGAVQFLCASDVLYQGRDWTCRSCGNRNWTSIGAIDREMTCNVCRKTIPAPVAGDWHFRADSFIVEAYREHGAEAVIWALSQLWSRARRSFYFAPSLSLWKTEPKGQGRDAEVDLLVVVDGKLYVCEVKSGSDLSKDERERLADIVRRIRPDTLLIALMEKPRAPAKLRSALAELIPAATDVELMLFGEDQLERGYYLIH